VSLIQKRLFFKKIFLLLLFMPLGLAAKIQNPKSVSLKMKGELDDDLFVVRANSSLWYFEDCLQMHNHTGHFMLDGVTARTQQIHGFIEYDKKILQKSDEIILVALANEREEINGEKSLLRRTHYKSVEFVTNGKVLIPSMMPEQNDLPNTPLWFNEDDGDVAKFNYYRAWENSIVNMGLIFPNNGSYSIALISKNDEIVASGNFLITEFVQNIHFSKTILCDSIGSNPMIEIDGSYFCQDDNSFSDDNKIKEYAIYKIVVTSKEVGVVYIPLPYPFVYINRIFGFSG
jgi:hypothetical protein